jgi:peptidoglycan/LPS O-acetylase OafA/YrhL
MYLNHFLLIEGPGRAFATAYHGGYTTFLIGYVVVIALSAAIATATFLLIESPFLQWRERLLASDRPATTGLPQESSPVPLRSS